MSSHDTVNQCTCLPAFCLLRNLLKHIPTVKTEYEHISLTNVDFLCDGYNFLHLVHRTSELKEAQRSCNQNRLYIYNNIIWKKSKCRQKVMARDIVSKLVISSYHNVLRHPFFLHFTEKEVYAEMHTQLVSETGIHPRAKTSTVMLQRCSQQPYF